MLDRGQFKDLFAGIQKVYWVPSYLAREDPNQKVLTPADLIKLSGYQALAEPAELHDKLKTAILAHANRGELVLCISAGAGGSLDEWLRRELTT